MAEQKYIAIGDIHGCYQSLEALLKKLEDYTDRQFIFIGDYIDRGPDSKKVVERLMELQQQKADCVFLRGNHEQMLLDAFNKGEFKLWVTNGGKMTLNSYGVGRFGSLPKHHLEFYNQTKFYYDTDDYFFVHAGLSAAKTIEESLRDEEEIEGFLWERSHLNAFETPWEKKVIFGHTPRPQPIRKNGMIGIDTGCVFKRMGYGKLTAVKLPEEEFIQQICLD
jgi:serine/threonine protein phosphatase 1